MEENQNQNPVHLNRKQENLLNQISPEQVLRPKGYYETIILDVLTVASALVSGYYLKLFLEQGAIIPLALSVSFFMVFSCLEVFLIRSLGRKFFILVLETIALLSFFANEPFKLLLIIGLVIIIFLFWGEVASRSETRNSIEIRFFKTVRPLVKKTITALSLLIVLLYLPQWSKGNNLISQNWFETITVSSIKTAESFYPELNFHSNVQDFSLSLAEYELKGNDSFNAMSTSTQKQNLDQIGGQIVETIGKYAGVSLSGKETISGVLYEVVHSTIERWRVGFGNWFLFVWAAAIFLSIRSVGALFGWVATFLGFCAYELLVGLNILHIRDELINRETIEFS